MIAEFVHLRVQSSYSMLESSLKIEQIIELAKKYQMPAVALTDRHNLFAALEFAMTAAKMGIQPINGVNLNIIYNNKDDKPLIGEIILLAKDATGYKNLLILASKIYIIKHHKDLLCIDIADLQLHNAGLIVLSGYTEGIVGKLLLSDNGYHKAKEHVKFMQQVFTENRYYMEVMRHDLMIEKQLEANYIKCARECDIPLVATNNILFAHSQMYDAHDTLVCIAEGAIKESTNRKFTDYQYYFKSSQEMQQIFADLPDAIANTVYIAKRCSVMAEMNEPMLPNFTDANISEDEEFRNQAKAGLVLRLQQKIALQSKIKLHELTITESAIFTEYPAYFSRLQYELDVICNMKFAGYFLIVSDFIRWSKENNIPVGPGRGSGAGSIVAWSLLITDLDPIRFGLLFERFLNPERVSMPDFDIDFCQERRDEVINYVRNKYGNNRVAQIITFGKLQAKAVIRDVARVLTLPYFLADKISKLVPFNAINPVTLKQAINEVAELHEASSGNGLYNTNLDKDEKELIKNVIDTALQLEGLHRHASIHAAGIVISGKDLLEVVPLYRDDNSEMFVIQYSMKYAELAGLVKFDFLGLKTLTVIAKSVELINRQGIEVTLNSTDLSDQKTYEMLTQGLSTGIFQFESPGMKESLRKLKPDSIEDLIALVSLYRPGPMDNIPTYIACKHNKQPHDYLHPLLKPILQETYGVIIYQEQVIEIAKTLAGYSLGAADLLRRAMGKKIKAEMDAQQQIFISGAKANKIGAEQAKQIFAAVEKFAGYGFNKSHAAAYAIISYHTAFLKANFPAEFLCASLNLDIHDSNKINIFIQEAKKFDIIILKPDINCSKGLFTIELVEGKQQAIRFALGALKNLSPETGHNIARIRSELGQFSNIFEFVEKIGEKDLNKRALETLIKAGAFDQIHANRNQLFSSVNIIIDYAQRFHRDKISNQMSLFESLNSQTSKYPNLGDIANFSYDEQAFKEYESIGFFFTNHPLDNYGDFFERKNIINSIYLFNELQDGVHQLRIAGIIHEKDTKMSARGRFIILHLSDAYGIYEATIFNEEILKRCSNLLETKIPLVLTCEIRKDEGGIKVAVLNVEDLKYLAYTEQLEYRITISETVNLPNLLKILKKYEINVERKNILQELKPYKDICDDKIVELTEIFDRYAVNNLEEKNLLSQIRMYNLTEGNVEITIIFNVNEHFVAKTILITKFLLLPRDINFIKTLVPNFEAITR